VDTVPNAEKLTKLLSLVADQLHGACFYGGADVPYFTHILEKDVKEVLKLTGFWNGAEE
jgi:hypothetical protein